jgi:hypothetical protein
MRINLVGQDITLESNADLSTHQYKFVKGVAAVAGGQQCRVDVTGANERMIGILQNKPSAAGLGAVVRIAGRSKLVTDTSAILAGSPLKSAAAGVASLAGTDKDKVGAIALEANGGVAIQVDALIENYDLAV